MKLVGCFFFLPLKVTVDLFKESILPRLHFRMLSLPKHLAHVEHTLGLLEALRRFRKFRIDVVEIAYTLLNLVPFALNGLGVLANKLEDLVAVWSCLCM